MAKVWVLETQTKGTGATMVPLERVLRKPGADPVPGFAVPKRKPRLPQPPQPRTPRRFKVVDVMTREILGEDVDARAVIGVLDDVGSVVDIEVFVWEPNAERWRMLTFGETQALWEYRGRIPELRAAGRARSSED